MFQWPPSVVDDLDPDFIDELWARMAAESKYQDYLSRSNRKAGEETYTIDDAPDSLFA